MPRLGALLIIFLAACSTATSIRQAEFRPIVKDKMHFLFSNLKTEYIGCLEGYERNDRVVFTEFRLGWLKRASPYSANVKVACNLLYPKSLAWVHSHMARYPEDRNEEDRNCYLSRTDIKSWRLSGLRYSVVQCSPTIWAVFWRDEADFSAVLLWPKNGKGRIYKE